MSRPFGAVGGSKVGSHPRDGDRWEGIDDIDLLVVVARLCEENATVKAVLMEMTSDDELDLTARLERAKLPQAVAARIPPHLRNAPTRDRHFIITSPRLIGDFVAVVESIYSNVLRPKHVVTSLMAGLIGSSKSQ